MTNVPKNPDLWGGWEDFRRFFEGFRDAINAGYGANFVFKIRAIRQSFQDWNNWRENDAPEIIATFENMARDPELSRQLDMINFLRVTLRELSRFLYSNKIVKRVDLADAEPNSTKLEKTNKIENEFFVILFCCFSFRLHMLQIFKARPDVDRMASTLFAEDDFMKIIDVCFDIQTGRREIGNVFDELMYKPVG
jgi:hypothetical protein